ncbi:glycerol uptake facilitator protein, partial [Trichococcus palustris]
MDNGIGVQMMGVFSTAPAIRHTASNIFGEAMGTGVLVFCVLSHS